MKIEKRKPKFKLGQVVTTPIGFRGVIISIKGKGNIKYIVSVDGNFGNHKISERKLLKLNPIKLDPSIFVEFDKAYSESLRSQNKKTNKATAQIREDQRILYAGVDCFRWFEKPKEPENELISSNIPWGKMAYSKLDLALHMTEMNKKASESYKRLKHGDLVEVKHTGVRLYVNGVHSIGGLYDIGVDWQIDCDVVIKDIHHDSLILIKRNND